MKGKNIIKENGTIYSLNLYGNFIGEEEQPVFTLYVSELKKRKTFTIVGLSAVVGYIAESVNKNKIMEIITEKSYIKNNVWEELLREKIIIDEHNENIQLNLFNNENQKRNNLQNTISITKNY